MPCLKEKGQPKNSTPTIIPNTKVGSAASELILVETYCGGEWRCGAKSEEISNWYWKSEGRPGHTSHRYVEEHSEQVGAEGRSEG